MLRTSHHTIVYPIFIFWICLGTSHPFISMQSHDTSVFFSFCGASRKICPRWDRARAQSLGRSVRMGAAPSRGGHVHGSDRELATRSSEAFSGVSRDAQAPQGDSVLRLEVAVECMHIKSVRILCHMRGAPPGEAEATRLLSGAPSVTKHRLRTPFMQLLLSSHVHTGIAE